MMIENLDKKENQFSYKNCNLTKSQCPVYIKFHYRFGFFV